MTVSPTSRYYGLETKFLERPDGTKVAYLGRRLVPSPDRFATLSFHVVLQGERLDNVTAKFLGDPEQFWRVADANGVLHPNELTDRVGARIRITLPEGIPGVADA